VNRHFARLTTAALALYWLTLFILTHLPPMKPPLGEGTDKYEHLLAFGLLAILLNTVLRRRLPRHADWLTLALVMAYGAIDERSQPPFGRTCDLTDWFADCTGAALGVVISATGHLLFTRCPTVKSPEPKEEAILPR
jgi:VanZ family protein